MSVLAVTFPMQDNVEAGTANWTADAYSWATTTADFHTSTTSWTDSAGGVYPNNMNASLTMTSGLDLYTTAINPKLSFWHRYQIETSFDFGYVEISLDNGATWALLKQFTGISNGWVREQIDLAAYAGQLNVMIRFRITTDKTVQWDGWYIDDIVIGDPPSAVAAFTVSNPTVSSLDVTWSQSLDTNFAAYSLRRATRSGVTEADPEVVHFTTVNMYSFSDSNLLPGTTYYYKLFVSNTFGLTAASKDGYASTNPGSVPYPFFDNMENGTGAWVAATPWALEVGFDHNNNPAGTYWTDSPSVGVVYGDNVNTSLTIDLDLLPANRPILTFWQRYNMETNQDFGLVEISTDAGVSWTTLLGVTGFSNSVWEQVKIDLTPYSRTQVKLRFRLDSNGCCTRGDGWMIDEVAVGEQAVATTTYPFYDSFDSYTSVLNNWVSANSNSQIVWNGVDGNGLLKGSASFPYNTNTSAAGVWQYIHMTMAHPINLVGTVKPQLSLWAKRYIDYDDHFHVQISTDNGVSWASLYDLRYYYPNPIIWDRLQFDLTPYANSNAVLVRFTLYGNGGTDTLLIDDVQIRDAAPDVVLSLPAQVSSDPEHSAQLSWSGVPDPYTFVQYEVRRATVTGVTRSSQLMATITNPAQTSYVDAMLNPGGTYFYKVFVLDIYGNASAGSNEQSLTTRNFSTLASHMATYPFADPVDIYSADAYSTPWSTQQTWGLDSGMDHNNVMGTYWSDSPGVGVNYADNQNSALTLNVDLTTTTRPILSFWHRYNMETNHDFGLVEISTNAGASWTTLLGVTGFSNTGWEQVKIDLTPYSRQASLIRFRLDSNAPNIVADGWLIDDVSVNEEMMATAPYPFYDNFDIYSSLAANWITANSASQISWSGVDGNGLIKGSAQFPYNTNTSAAGVWQNIHMTMAHPIDLTTSVNPQLSLWAKRYIDYDDHFYVQISTDNGVTWATLYDLRYYYPNPTIWDRLQFDLTPYTNSNAVLIRFALYANGGTDTLLIDDVQIRNAAIDVVQAAPALVTIDPQHSATVSWSAFADSYTFVQYEVRRSTTPGVTIASQLMTTITDPTTTSFTDTSLNPGGIYYYKVFVVDIYGNTTFGSNEQVAQTFNFATMPTHMAKLPFSDPVDVYSTNATLSPWAPQQTWGLENGFDHHNDPYGVYWSDSPGVGNNYPANVNSSLTLNLDLNSGLRPILTFWQRYNMETDVDFGMVEISRDNGATWQAIHSTTGANFAWEQVKVDLTPWSRQPVQLRFRIDANGPGIEADGWQIDDVSVINLPQTTASYPFVDHFDSYASLVTNWVSGNSNSGWYWDGLNGSPALGSVSLDQNWSSSETGYISYEFLTMSNVIDLTPSKNPQLSFWTRHGYYDAFYAQISLDAGATWVTVWSYGAGWISGWHQVNVDLTPYKATNAFLVRFYHHGWNATGTQYFMIDDVRVGENLSIPSTVHIHSGDGQAGLRGQLLSQPLTVQVLDSSLFPFPGQVVDFAVTGGTGTVSPYSAVTNTSGLASTTLTLDAYVTANSVTATVNGTTQSVSFSADGYPAGVPVYLTKVSGDNQVLDTYATSTYPLIIQVTDIVGSPVRDVYVQYSVIGGDALMFDPYAVVSDAYGYASNWLIARGYTGSVTASASVAGLRGSPLAFSATTVLPGGVLGDTDGDGIPDAWETAHGLNPLNAADAILDGDADGLNNLSEFAYATNPANPDSDGDGMPDGWEVTYGLNPLNAADAIADANGNGVSNLHEFINGTIPVHLPHFASPKVTNSWMDVFGNITIAGIPANVGSEVAAYDPQGVLCGRFVVNQQGNYGFMHVYADDPTTAGIDEGATLGDRLSFRIWDVYAGIELSAVTSVPVVWGGDGVRQQVNLDGADAQMLPLHAGWNLMSFSVKRVFYDQNAGAPTEPMLPGSQMVAMLDIGYAFPSLFDVYGNPLFDVIRSFDSLGAHTYDPLFPQFSDLTYVAGGYGYWIKMKQPMNMLINGIRANATDTLPLHSGWNLIGYWNNTVKYSAVSQPTVAFPGDISGYQQVGNMDAIITSIFGQYDVIRSHDINGAHTYDPALGTFNDMNYMAPGYGIWIRMKQVGNLSY